jgi:hypothetical protein
LCRCVVPLRTSMLILTTPHEPDSLDRSSNAFGVRGNGEMWRESSMTWRLHIVPARARQKSGDVALCHAGNPVDGPESASASIRWPSLPWPLETGTSGRFQTPNLSRSTALPRTCTALKNAPYALPRSLTLLRYRPDMRKRWMNVATTAVDMNVAFCLVLPPGLVTWRIAFARCR